MSEAAPVKWAKLIDQTLCIGCHACTTACKSENEVPVGVTRTYVKSADVGIFPQARRAFQVTRCNQCEDAPCTVACPTRAMFRRPDGIVDFDKSICIGCKACIAACPYDAIFINPDDHSAEKCNFCAHRIDIGLEPACVVVCPTQAIVVGDLNDPTSRVSQLVNRQPVSVRRPEKDTRPKLFYRGAHQATLDPIAAKRPAGGLFAWAEQPTGSDVINSGHPGDGAGRSATSPGWNSSAAAVLSYDIAHSAPWDWRVSLYTWTKGIAAGAYLIALLMVLLGTIPENGALWLLIAPGVSMIFLAVTAALLVWDLEQPARFLYVLTRPQWKSWLTRGALILTAYGAVLFAHLAATLLGSSSAQRTLAVAGAPLAIGTAAYTAYLFAQAKARDLWQNPLAPVQLVVQACVLGAGALVGDATTLNQSAGLFGGGNQGGVLTPFGGVANALSWILSAACALHLLLVFVEVTLTHNTAHARLAAWEMTRGRYAAAFRAGVLLVAVGMAAPWIGGIAAAAALVGVLVHEHAYVQAGQAVPLA